MLVLGKSKENNVPTSSLKPRENGLSNSQIGQQLDVIKAVNSRFCNIDPGTFNGRIKPLTKRLGDAHANTINFQNPARIATEVLECRRLIEEIVHTNPLYEDALYPEIARTRKSYARLLGLINDLNRLLESLWKNKPYGSELYDELQSLNKKLIEARDNADVSEEKIERFRTELNSLRAKIEEFNPFGEMIKIITEALRRANYEPEDLDIDSLKENLDPENYTSVSESLRVLQRTKDATFWFSEGKDVLIVRTRDNKLAYAALSILENQTLDSCSVNLTNGAGAMSEYLTVVPTSMTFSGVNSDMRYYVAVDKDFYVKQALKTHDSFRNIPEHRRPQNTLEFTKVYVPRPGVPRELFTRTSIGAFLLYHGVKEIIGPASGKRAITRIFNSLATDDINQYLFAEQIVKMSDEPNELEILRLSILFKIAYGSTLLNTYRTYHAAIMDPDSAPQQTQAAGNEIIKKLIEKGIFREDYMLAEFDSKKIRQAAREIMDEWLNELFGARAKEIDLSTMEISFSASSINSQ